ncbi:MAG: hypothetical protein O4805_04795 [Trichodesmium sp. St16_bin2-tuft]|nr:hypothetical protein [Trichodesmium sp. St16_bin2-tuft]
MRYNYSTYSANAPLSQFVAKLPQIYPVGDVISLFAEENWLSLTAVFVPCL